VQLVPWDYNPSKELTIDIEKLITGVKDKEMVIKKP
jgi:hypothetical protein